MLKYCRNCEIDSASILNDLLGHHKDAMDEFIGRL